MNKKKLTAKIVNKAISGVRFGFATTVGLTNAGFGMVDEMASYFSGVPSSHPIGDTLWHCGQDAVTSGMNILQKAISNVGKE